MGEGRVGMGRREERGADCDTAAHATLVAGTAARWREARREYRREGGVQILVA